MIGIQLPLTQLRIVIEFLAKLKTFNFNINTTELANIQIPGRLVSKKECLDLLRTLPSLKGEQFKNDLTLANYLRIQESKDHLKFVLGGLDPKQSLEIEEALKKIIQEQPTATEAAATPTQEAAAEQSTPVGTTQAQPEGLPFGAPSGATISPVTWKMPKRQLPEEAKGGKEGGTGTGSAVRRKIQLNEAANAPKVPNTQLRNPLQEQGPATTKINRLQASTTNPGLKFQTGPGNTLKNLGSSAGRFTKRNLGRIANGLTNSVLPAGANLLGRTGLGAINHGGNFLSNLSNTRSRMASNIKGAGSNLSSSLKGGRKVALASALVFLLVLVVAINGAMTGTTPTGEASPIIIGGGDIASCKFTRGDMTPKEASFKSNLLLSYIQEAAQKSSIPPAVLAAFIRVESPSASNKSDGEIANYAANCAQSPTKALGIMQIQPPGTTSAAGDPASCDDCIDAGAKLVGKTVSTMTRADYCDPRTSIIVGAGWILKKMTYWGYGDGTKWNPAWTNDKKAITTLVNTYYGDVLYPDVNTGPFNYADDVSTSIQSCQTTATTPTDPILATPTLSSIVTWDEKIISSLVQGMENLFNKLLVAINNSSYSTGTWPSTDIYTEYYCTYSIIDAYNLAGISGLTKSAHGAVAEMHKFWKGAQAGNLGYKYIDYRSDGKLIRFIQPGYAIFMESKPETYTGDEHAALVKEKQIDDQGNGFIITNDSNSSQKTYKYSVAGWSVKNTPFAVTGFGGI